MARFEILSGPEAGHVVELPPGRHLAGRHASAALRLQAAAVSSRHLELEVGKDGTVRFQDLGSTNGTWAGGVKVGAGEWAPGAELRLGDVRVRLLDPAGRTAAVPAGDREVGEISLEEEPLSTTLEIPEEEGEVLADADLHRRALEETLQGGRRGGRWLPLLFVLLLAAAGGVFFLLRAGGGEGGVRLRGPRGEAEARGPRDLLQGAGAFDAEAAEAWVLGAGLRFGPGRLENPGEGWREARLARVLLPPAAGGIAFEAQTTALRAWPLLEWGREEGGPVAGLLVGAALGSGPVRLAVPSEAAWLRLVLLLQGSGSLSGLLATEAEAAPVEEGRHEDHAWRRQGGNLLLLDRDGEALLQVAASSSGWKEAEGGFRLDLETGGWALVLAGPRVREAGPALVRSEGGPQAPVPGLRLEASPGLILGGGSRHFWLGLEPAGPLSSSEGRLRLGPVARATVLDLRWDLSAAFGLASRLARELENAARAGDSRGVLEVSARLLRDHPLDPEDVERALELRRQVLDEGQRALEALRLEAAEALFLNATRSMEELAARARELAERLPGTLVAASAEELAGDLQRRAAESGAERRERARAYRERLRAALERSYPGIAAWIAARDGEETP